MTIEEEFKERWPEMFTDVRCGFWLPDGWRDLLWEACEAIEPLVKDAEFTVDQVKSKFGGLRFYVSGDYPGEVDDIINAAEDRSIETCEGCGNPGKRGGSGWIATMCEGCGS